MHENGSSPLTRGKQVWFGCRVVRERLIPAHAGKTVMSDNLMPDP